MSRSIRDILTRCKVRANYFIDVLSVYPRVVIAEHTGSGKTLGVAELISLNWEQGVLYLAEYKASLDEMRDMLIELGVPSEAIGVYHKDSKHTRELYRDMSTCPNRVALVTHARIKDEPLTRWVFWNPGEPDRQREIREFAIVDEPIETVRIFDISRSFVNSLLRLALPAVRLQEIDNVIEDAKGFIWTEKLDQQLFEIAELYTNFSEEFHANLDSKFNGNRKIDVIKRAALLGRVLSSVLRGNYELLSQTSPTEIVKVNVSASTEVELARLCKQTIVLDATGDLTPYMHDFLVCYRQYAPDGKISKLVVLDDEFTKAKTSDYNKKTGARGEDKIVRALRQFIEVIGEDQEVLVFAWKDHEDALKKLIPKKWELVHYGGTRGSNNYRHHSKVVLLGSFYKNSGFYIKYEKVLRTRINITDSFVAVAEQEYGRSRVRSGKSIELYLATDDRAWVGIYKRLVRFNQFNGTPEIIEFKGDLPRESKFISIILRIITKNPISTNDLRDILRKNGVLGIRYPSDIEVRLNREYSEYPVKVEDKICSWDTEKYQTTKIVGTPLYNIETHDIDRK